MKTNAITLLKKYGKKHWLPRDLLRKYWVQIKELTWSGLIYGMHNGAWIEAEGITAFCYRLPKLIISPRNPKKPNNCLS